MPLFHLFQHQYCFAPHISMRTTQNYKWQSSITFSNRYKSTRWASPSHRLIPPHPSKFPESTLLLGGIHQHLFFKIISQLTSNHLKHNACTFSMITTNSHSKIFPTCHFPSHLWPFTSPSHSIFLSYYIWVYHFPNSRTQHLMSASLDHNTTLHPFRLLHPHSRPLTYNYIQPSHHYSTFKTHTQQQYLPNTSLCNFSSLTTLSLGPSIQTLNHQITTT